MTPEGDITTAILKWLNQQHGVWAIKIHAGGYQGRGVPDIIGVWHGRMLALEVKRPDGGIISNIQKHRVAKILATGAIAGVVTSVSDTKALITKHTDERQSR